MSLNPPCDPIDAARDHTAIRRAILVVSADGRIQFAMAQSDPWIRDLFTAASPLERLPEALTRLLRDRVSDGSSSKFIVGESGKQFCIQVLCREANCTCLLVEHYPGIPVCADRRRALTDRQTEVLSWVARGKTNAEIGKLLSLKTGTVGKYLERIFTKLGVENRTAAASFVTGTDNAPSLRQPL